MVWVAVKPTSKVAVVSRLPDRDGVDVDYLFLQVFVDQAIVSDTELRQHSAGASVRFAIERGLVDAGDAGDAVTSSWRTPADCGGHRAVPGGVVSYAGDALMESAQRRPRVYQVTRQRAARCCPRAMRSMSTAWRSR
jgi:2-methylaconitate cis-trans-isomerase PrpF